MADSNAERTEDVFDFERIGHLIELMKEHDLSELDLRQADQQIRLCRATASTPLIAPQLAAAAPSPPQPATASQAPVPAPAEESDEHVAYITSPMVGTFYSRSNPNADAFVKVGDHVEKETTVCIVEAMKVFNEIPAEISGQIVAILVEDEEPVDFGKPLFKVDTSK